MPTTSLWVDKILRSYLLGSDFCLNTPFIFLCFLLEMGVARLHATFGKIDLLFVLWGGTFC